ncbi:MAG: PKD domain-containing protein [Microthrixaceae bacterium]|nr:PKD domain-containing protein [Microthrixaceae bacterium]
MSRFGLRGRAFVAFASVAVLAGVLVPGAEAQKVATPGPFKIIPRSGSLSLGATPFDLTPRPLPECSDGFDNEADGRIDLADPQCVAGPNGEPASADDSEVAGGFQPKGSTELTGTIDADGNIVIPTSGVIFPTIYLAIDAGIGTGVVRADIVATHPAEGTLDPITGEAQLRVRLKVKLFGAVAGVGLGYECSIGTDAGPIDITFTTGTSTSPGGGSSTGSPYAASGDITVVNNTFAVPGAYRCGDAPFYLLTGIVSSQVGLPSASGRNAAVLSGVVDPAPQPAIVVNASATPSVGSAPLDVDFDASASSVASGPATYRWVFPDGSTETGARVSHTFSEQGTKAVDLTVTDADGDSATKRLTVQVTAPASTTTTTTSTTTTTTTSTTTTTQPTTTTTQPTTTTTQPTTTTTQPTTTTTTTSTTTTTEPTTTTTTTAVPDPSGDSISVGLKGSTTYSAAGLLDSGDVTVGTRDGRVAYVRGAGSVAGPSGGSARVGFHLDRVWFFDFWVGQISVTDRASGVRTVGLFAGSPRVATDEAGAVTVSGRAAALEALPAPRYLGVVDIDWSVTDAD